ncbi:MAG: lamin tail domain-containing protein [Chloroflexia bacterium]
MRTTLRLTALFLLCLLPLLTPTPNPLPLHWGREQGEGVRAAGDVVINEVAWMGTAYDANDEWIELYNNTAAPIDLTGWTLRAADGTPNITLVGTIPAHGYFLLERTDDTTIPDIPADQTYTGALGNTGEVLTLRDAGGNVVDTANGDGGGWPAGNNTTKQTMERIDPTAPDTDANWGSNTTWIRNGHDAGGNPLNGTPKQRNSLSWPDLALSKTAPAAAPVGSPLIYRITLLNQGPLAAPSVLLTDTLPAGFLYAAHAGPYPCTLAGSTFSCQVGEVSPAGQATITLTGTVALTASGTLLNVVWATTAITEVTGTNNLAQAATVVQEAYADLAVAKAGPGSIHAGDTLTYTLAVTNIGQLEAPAIRLTDTLPSGAAFLSQESPYPWTRPTPDTVVWEVGTLLPGGAARVVLHAQALPTVTGTLTNTARASTSAVEGNPDNNVARWRTLVLLPGQGQVVINEVAWAGTQASTADEWIELYNASPYDIDLSGWTLSDGGDISITLQGTIPAGGYFLLERTDDSTISDIPADQFFSGILANAGEVLTLRDAGGNVVDTANGDGGGWPAGTASPNYQTMERIAPLSPDTDANWASNDMVHRNGHDAGGNPVNGTPKALNSASLPPPPSADLAVSKTGPLTATPGTTLAYTLAVTNAGTLDALAVRLTDTLPAGTTFISQSSSFPFMQPTTGTLVWDPGVLSASASAQIALYARVEPFAAGVLTNRITATTAVTEANPADNTAFCTTTVVFPGEAHVLIEAVLYDGYVLEDHDEAVRLVNVGSAPADLSGWKVCDAGSGGSCAILPGGTTLLPGRRLWLAWYGDAFFSSFGFLPDYEKADTRPEVPNLGGSWPGFSNTGDEAVLRSPTDEVMDTMVFEGGSTSTPGWSGPALFPYAGSGNFGSEGQILQRILDEGTGLPVADTNTAADWFQYPGDALYGRRVLYPGWDLDAFFRPLSATEAASLTVAIAPDHAGEIFLEAIGLARERIEAEFYELENYDIVRALVGQAQSGVSVTVLLEGEVAGGISDQELWACQQLHAAGGACWFMFNESSVRIYDRYTNMHSKLMLLDRRWALISSQNPTAGGLPTDDKSDGTWGSRGVLILTDAPSVVARALALFQADFDPAAHLDLTRWSPSNPYGYGPPPPGFQPITQTGGITSSVVFTAPLRLSGTFSFELFSAPEAALRQSDALLGLLARAGPGDQVDVEQMYEYRAWGAMPDYTPAPNLRLEAYIAAARRGAAVRILLNSGSFGEAGYDLSKNLETVAYVNDLARREGLNLRARLGDPTRYGIHNKMVLVRLGDRGYAHIGSINGSETSSKVNREAALQIASDAVYAYLEEMFEWDWYHSTPIHLPLVYKHYLTPADHLLVSEVLYDPEGTDAGKEWVEIYNPTNHPVDLSGWTLGDAAAIGEYGSGRYVFPTGTVIPARTVWTIAAQAQDVAFRPTFEFLIDPLRDDPSVPNMVPVGTWDGFGFALGNEGDEVILLDASESPVDVLVYGAGSYPGVVPHPGVSAQGHSLERRPADRDTDDCSADFFDRYPPTPGVVP